MEFSEFERRAQRVFAEIPPEYREGVDGLLVRREAVPHPTLPDVYTLGECITETYPTEWGGPGEVRSFVVLYHGSFRRLAALDEAFDWEAELQETVHHEVRHHLESLASEDELEEQDYAADQNFARREGEPFDPLFYRAGEPLAEDAWEVEGDVFLERELSAAEFAALAEIPVEWEGRALRVPRPAELGDAHFVTLWLEPPPGEGELVLVLLRRRGVLESLRGLLSEPEPRVLTSEVELPG